MSVAIKASPLNHYLTTSPAATARTLNRKAFAYSLLEKISWVALAAIAAFVVFSSITAPVITGTVSLAMIGLSLSVLFFAWGAMLCRNWSQKATAQAEIENSVAKKLNDIKDWKTTDVTQFLENKTTEMDEFLGNHKRQKPLKKINDAEPLCALKPLIARIAHLTEKAQKIQEVAFKALEGSKKPSRSEPERQVQYMTREVSAYDLETKAYPMLFEAAVLWAIMANPTQERSVEEYGSYVIKSHGERASDKLMKEGEDEYFVFHDKIKTPINFGDIRIETTSWALAERLGTLNLC